MHQQRPPSRLYTTQQVLPPHDLPSPQFTPLPLTQNQQQKLIMSQKKTIQSGDQR